MFHPLEQDLSSLKDPEIEQKLQELTKKYHQAYRLGNADLLTQLSTFITIYKNEMSKRYQEKFTKDIDNDLDQLINVD
jgi:hypothetical protein